MRRSIWNHRYTRNIDLSIETSWMWRVHNVFHASLWQYKENEVHEANQNLSSTKTNVWGKNHPKTLKTRMELPILHQVKRLSNHQGIMGTRGTIYRHWRAPRSVQASSLTMNRLTPEATSLLLLTNDVEELDWYFQDIFNQFRNLYCFLHNISCLFVDCPLEFLLFETQQLVSFLHCY